MTSTKFLRYFFTALFSFGAITLIGVLSFSGMLYLSGSLAAAVASTVLAVLIEGEIYRRNVLGGTGMILSFGQFLVRDNYCDQLKILAKDENARGNCNFLQDYYNLRKHLHTLSHAKKLSASQRQSQQRTEKSLAKMEDFFIRYINDTLDSDNGSEQNLSRDMDNQFKAEKTTIRATLANTIYSKKVWLWLTSPITVAGGVMAFFVAASQLAEAFAALGLVSSSLMLAVWPVAGLAAVGFMLMTYNTFVDIIHHQKWRKNWSDFKDTMRHAGALKKLVAITGMVLLVCLAVFATVATAGTWWEATQSGILLLPVLAAATPRFKLLFSIVGIALLGLGTLAFEYANSLQSYAMMAKGLSLKDVPKAERTEVATKSYFAKIITVLSYQGQRSYQAWLKKPVGVRLNPFAFLNKIIELPFRLVLFIGHLISIGVTGDRLGNLHPAITSTVGALQEGMTDIHYLWGGDCGHHHSDLAGYFLNTVLAPLKFVSASWNAAFGDKAFTEYLRKEFGVGKEKAIESVRPSTEWQQYEVDQRLTQEINRLKPATLSATLSGKLAAAKSDLFTERLIGLRQAVVSSAKESNVGKKRGKVALWSERDYTLLSCNRSTLFAVETTASTQAAQSIERDYPDLFTVVAH